MSIARPREIKFRGKYHLMSTDERIWVYGCNDYGDIIDDQDERWRVDESTVGQWTGTVDDEGREIYEGDIVKADWCSEIACPPGPSFTGIVLYINKAAAFYVVREDERACPIWWCLKMRVLGNVFDKEYNDAFGRIWDMNGDF